MQRIKENNILISSSIKVLLLKNLFKKEFYGSFEKLLMVNLFFFTMFTHKILIFFMKIVLKKSIL